MTKQLSEAIINRSKIRNRYIKWPSCKNVSDYRQAKNMQKPKQIPEKVLLS